MNMGAYKTKIVLFDAYNCKYMTETHSAYDDDSGHRISRSGVFLNLILNLMVKIRMNLLEPHYTWIVEVYWC